MTAARECSRIDWWTWIRDADLPHQAKLVAYALSTFMDPDGGRCWPGQDRIARACGWKWDNPVRDWTRWLEGAGLLRIVRHGGIRPKGRAQATHLYVPLLPVDDQTGQPSGQDTDDQPGRNDDQPGQRCDQTGQPSGGPSQSLPHQLEPHHQNGGGSPNGEEGQGQDPPAWLDAHSTTLYERMGQKLYGRLLAEPEAARSKLRTAVMEQVKAGVDPSRLARAITEKQLDGVGSLAGVLAWRASNEGPALVAEARKRSTTDNWLDAYEERLASEPERRAGVTMHD